MSDWSSFEKDKAITDKWRSFLSEQEEEQPYLAYANLQGTAKHQVPSQTFLLFFQRTDN